MARLGPGLAGSVLVVALAAQAATAAWPQAERTRTVDVSPISGLATVPAALGPIAEAARLEAGRLVRHVYDFRGFRPFHLIAYHLARAVQFLCRTALRRSLPDYAPRNQ